LFDGADDGFGASVLNDGSTGLIAGVGVAAELPAVAGAGTGVSVGVATSPIVLISLGVRDCFEAESLYKMYDPPPAALTIKARAR
jgi:phosphoribosylcarboxyaminoimidazole (NCAIR) mutase